MCYSLNPRFALLQAVGVRPMLSRLLSSDVRQLESAPRASSSCGRPPYAGKRQLPISASKLANRSLPFPAHIGLLGKIKVPDRIFGSVKDGNSSESPRCHLDSRVFPCALCRIPAYPRQLTYAHTSQNTQTEKSFDCALGGPFGRLHLDPALTFPDSLCAHDCFDLRFNGLKHYFIFLNSITSCVPCQENSENALKKYLALFETVF